MKTFLFVGVALSMACRASAGTFKADWDNAPCWTNKALATGTPGKNFGVISGSDNVRALFACSDASCPAITGKGGIGFYVTWTPGKAGETAPTKAYVTVELSANLFGPNGSVARVLDGKGKALADTLGKDGKYVRLYCRVFEVSLSRELDGSMSGQLDIPTDQLCCAGGATVRERASIVAMADHAPNGYVSPNAIRA